VANAAASRTVGKALDARWRADHCRRQLLNDIRSHQWRTLTAQKKKGYKPELVTLYLANLVPLTGIELVTFALRM